MRNLTPADRAQLKASVERDRALTASISLPATMLAVTSAPAIQLSDEKLVRQGILAEFTNQSLSDIIQARQAASYETSLTMRSISSMFNYIAIWAYFYDLQLIQSQLAKYDLKQFSNLEDLRRQLREDTRGKLFWNQYWKAGIVACILVGASGMAIFTAGFGAPVSAFLAAQFTAYPTIATTVAAGSMLVLTSSIMCLHSSVRKAFRRMRGLPATSQLLHARLQQGGISTQQSLGVRDAAQPESALQPHREIPLDPTHPAPPKLGGKRPVHMERQAKPSGTKLHGSGAQDIKSERPGRWPKTQVTRATESALQPQTGIPLDPTHPAPPELDGKRTVIVHLHKRVKPSGRRLRRSGAQHIQSEHPRRWHTTQVRRELGVADTQTSKKE